MEEFNKLEEKITNLVKNLKTLKDENNKLKSQLTQFKQGATELDKERAEIKTKVQSLIDMIDSLE